MMKIISLPPAVIAKYGSRAWPLGLAGAGLLILGSLLSWSYDPAVLGDLSLCFNPGGLQIMAIALALLATGSALWVAQYSMMRPIISRLPPRGPSRMLFRASVATASSRCSVSG